jgi:nuclease S1
MPRPHIRSFGRRLALTWLILSLAPQVLAWGKEGHQIVAIIAAQGLSASASSQVATLLEGKSLADVASEPDEWRKTDKETEGWHFVDIPISAAGYDVARDCPVQSSEVGRDCIVAAIQHFRVVLGDKSAPKADRVRALTFIVHFMGDIHQPLHCANHDDHGGNDVPVKWFGQTTLNGYPENLHSVWDEGIIDRAGMDAAVYAQHLLQMPPLADMPPGTAAMWANESFTLAKEDAYKLPKAKATKSHPLPLGQSYYEASLPIVDAQLLRAGLRLRELLDATLGTP